ncbi:MAG TPA: phospholipase [Alphaproteobacteria bacterium]|nr:phospholipase [Alphaproteobacteria bacterium]
MTARQEKTSPALDAALQPLLEAIDVMDFIARHMNPPDLPDIIAGIGYADMPLRESMGALQNMGVPESLQPALARIDTASGAVCLAYEELRRAAAKANGLMETYYALRHGIFAREQLYPLAAQFTSVSRHFLEEAARDDEALLGRLAAGAEKAGVGLMHSKEASGDARGGFSIYVPETYDAAKPHPVIMALHGAGGRGRGFLWSWLRAARPRGIILVSPTSRGQTWSLDGPDIDTPNLSGLMDQVRERWNVDEKHMLMTGMSDGGSFTYMSGLQEDQPYTHLAPVAASFPPLMLEFYNAERLKGLPVHITHGALDWLFPPIQGRAMASGLQSFDAKVVYREIDDLSHTNPDDEENAEVMDWFLSGG